MQSYPSRCLAALLVALAVLLAPSRPALAGGGDGDFHQVVDGYDVHLEFLQPVVPGVTAVQVHLSGADGAPVNEARVQISQNLTFALNAGGHGEAGGEAPADDAAVDHDGGSVGGHTESETAHGHAEPAEATPAPHAETAADPHSEAEPHTHDDSSLYQLRPAELEGTYGGSVIFFQAGQWAVHVEFSLEGETQQHAAEFMVDVLPPDRGGLMLATFAGINAAILGMAAVIKRKSPAA